jgi:hypothetical protein
MNFNKIRIFWIVLALILFAGFALRIHRLPETLTFLSDQGRDAIVLKRLVTLEKLVFVGPTTSIGNVFTGPFYYYLVAPFMLLWRLDPIGPAYGVAIINVIGIALCTYFTAKNFGKTTAFIFTIFATFSANQILQSRFSWNPNPLPVFTFGSMLALWYAQKTKGYLAIGLSGVLLGLSIQLHYIAVAIPFVLFGFLKADAIKNYRNILTRQTLVTIITFLSFILITFTPLILFEIKNGFINTKTFFRATETGEVIAKNTTQLQRLADTSKGFFYNTFSINFADPYISLYALLIFCVIIYFIAVSDKRHISYFARGSLTVLLINILILSRLETGRHMHYFNIAYLPAFFLIGYLFDRAFTSFKNLAIRSITVIAIVTFCLWVALAQSPNLKFIFASAKNHTQISHARDVARYILENKNSDSYQVVGLPFYETEGHYRYFLEYLGQRPMPSDSLGDPKELFVICHELDKINCDISGNPQWQIADFQNRHRDWKFHKDSNHQIDHISIYRLIY